MSQDNQIAGCYLHGIFDQGAVVALIMKWAGGRGELSDEINLADSENVAINKLADACENHLDINKIDQSVHAWYQRQ